MKTKNGGGENLFSPAPLFFVFPDAMHPAGGIYAAQPVAADVISNCQREKRLQYSLPVPLLGPGSMTLVRGLGLNKPHIVPQVSLAHKLIRTHQKYPEQVFGWVREGAFDSKASSRPFP